MGFEIHSTQHRAQEYARALMLTAEIDNERRILAETEFKKESDPFIKHMARGQSTRNFVHKNSRFVSESTQEFFEAFKAGRLHERNQYLTNPSEYKES